MVERMESPQLPKDLSNANDEDEAVKVGDNFELPAWMKGGRTLPGLCSSKCDESSTNDLSTSAEVMTSGLCSQVPVDIVSPAPTCNADSVNDIARGKWRAVEPYAFARPLESYDKANRKQGRVKERSNYAKALLLSEKELEKLAQKIRAEIHQSEMFEVAVEAERAADAGFETFFARPSTFGSDDGISGSIYLPSNRKSSFLRRSSAQLLPEEKGKMRLFDLRNASEVIPPWKKLHAHMRTHLYREKVNEHSLAFKELGRLESTPHLDARDNPNDSAVESGDLTDGMATLSLKMTETGGFLFRNAVDQPTKHLNDRTGTSLGRLSKNMHKQGFSRLSGQNFFRESYVEDEGCGEEKNLESSFSSPLRREGVESSPMVNCFGSQFKSSSLKTTQSTLQFDGFSLAPPSIDGQRFADFHHSSAVTLSRGVKQEQILLDEAPGRNSGFVSQHSNRWSVSPCFISPKLENESKREGDGRATLAEKKILEGNQGKEDNIEKNPEASTVDCYSSELLNARKMHLVAIPPSSCDLYSISGDVVTCDVLEQSLNNQGEQLGSINAVERTVSGLQDFELESKPNEDSLNVRRPNPQNFAKLDSDRDIGDSICHSFQLSEDNFNVAVQEMISRLSPISCSQPLGEYFDRKDNEKFLREHFYCKVVETKSFELGPSSLTETICLAPCNGYHRGCHVFGFETVCSGVEFVFSNGNRNSASTSHTPGNGDHRQNC